MQMAAAAQLSACSNTFKLNTLLAVHKSYTYALAACVRAAMLWFGGVALFADLMTVGEWVITLSDCTGCL
jgi:hypothetical protein